MLDDTTRIHFKNAVAYAERNGLDLAEALESYGLLLSLDRRKMVEKSTLAALLVQLDEQPDTVLANLGGNQTVTGAVNGVKEFIRLYAQMLEKS